MHNSLRHTDEKYTLSTRDPLFSKTQIPPWFDTTNSSNGKTSKKVYLEQILPGTQLCVGRGNDLFLEAEGDSGNGSLGPKQTIL
jgi:hypothetical protein